MAAFYEENDLNPDDPDDFNLSKVDTEYVLKWLTPRLNKVQIAQYKVQSFNEVQLDRKYYFFLLRVENIDPNINGHIDAGLEVTITHKEEYPDGKYLVIAAIDDGSSYEINDLDESRLYEINDTTKDFVEEALYWHSVFLTLDAVDKRFTKGGKHRTKRVGKKRRKGVGKKRKGRRKCASAKRTLCVKRR